MKKRFTKERIIGFLREAKSGLPGKYLCHRQLYCRYRAHCRLILIKGSMSEKAEFRKSAKAAV